MECMFRIVARRWLQLGHHLSPGHAARLFEEVITWRGLGAASRNGTHELLFSVWRHHQLSKVLLDCEFAFLLAAFLPWLLHGLVGLLRRTLSCVHLFGAPALPPNLNSTHREELLASHRNNLRDAAVECTACDVCTDELHFITCLLIEACSVTLRSCWHDALAQLAACSGTVPCRDTFEAASRRTSHGEPIPAKSFAVATSAWPRRPSESEISDARLQSRP